MDIAYPFRLHQLMELHLMLQTLVGIIHMYGKNTEENPVMGRVCTVLVNDSGVFAANCSSAYIPTGKIEKKMWN